MLSEGFLCSRHKFQMLTHPISVLLSFVTHSLFNLVDIFGLANLGGASAFGGIGLGEASLSTRNMHD